MPPSLHHPNPTATSQWYALHGTHSSVLIECPAAAHSPEGEPANPAPLWRYWGVRLPDDCLRQMPLSHASTLGNAPNSLDREYGPSVFALFGLGERGLPALLASRIEAQTQRHHDFAHGFDAVQVAFDPAAQRLRFTLNDSVATLSVLLELQLNAHDVLTLRTTLINQGDTPLHVQHLASAHLPLPSEANQVLSFFGQWSAEWQAEQQGLGNAEWRRENRNGRTGHQHFPGALVAEQFDWFSGTTYAAHLAWSGNHQQVIAPQEDGSRLWQLGLWLAPGELVLAPGARFEAPEVLATCSPHGKNGVMHNMHRAMRSRLQWPAASATATEANTPPRPHLRPQPRPIHLNTWEAIYFNHQPDSLRELATQAARVGVERFVLDDGWFAGRHNDHTSLGDWWPDADKYPQGLRPLAEHVRALGMQFGLWVEPEMVSPRSQLYAAHPDWALQMQGRAMQTSRHQLVLDMARPEVRHYLFEMLDTLLRETPIAYLKWDMNRDLTQAAHAEGHPAYLDFVQGFYALLARLREAHPQVEIESCSSGGARMDAGVLPYVQRFWLSDNTDALSRLGMQRNALLFFPPEVLGAHIGPTPYHTTGRDQDLSFRAAVAMPLHLGLELDVRQLNPTQTDTLTQLCAWYKTWRDQLHGQIIWQGECGDAITWHASGDAKRLLLLIYRAAPTQQRHAPTLKLPMLNPHTPYTLRTLLPPANHASNQGRQAPFHQDLQQAIAQTLPGAWLTHIGLPLPRMAAESATVWLLEQGEVVGS